MGVKQGLPASCKKNNCKLLRIGSLEVAGAKTQMHSVRQAPALVLRPPGRDSPSNYETRRPVSKTSICNEITVIQQGPEEGL